MPESTVDEAGIDLSTQRAFVLGAARVDPQSHEATFGGTSERIQPQNLKVLVALAQKRGKVVTRDELIRRCWNGRFIGDDVINRAISTLRQFAERAGGFEIETVPREGYRLVEKASSHRKRLARALGVTALIIAASLAGVSVESWWKERSKQDPEVITIALLPFRTDGHDPTTQAVAFAAHDSVSHALEQTRFALTERNTNDALASHADFLISANVTGAADSIVATVRMEQAANHTIVYSHRVAVSRDKADSVAEMVGPQVAGDLGRIEPIMLVAERDSSNPIILADLLQQSDLRQVDWLSDYQRTRRDAEAAPNSAVVQMAFAVNTAHYLINIPLEQRTDAVAAARRAADRAEHLAPQFGDTYVPWCLLHSHVRLRECEDRLRGAMQRDPTAPWVAYTLADRLKDAGRLSEALNLARQSLAADQFIPDKIALTLRLLESTNNTSDAKDLYAQAHHWWPQHKGIFWDRFYGILARGDFDALVRFADQRSDYEMDDFENAILAGISRVRDAVKSNSVSQLRSVCPLTAPPTPKRDTCLMAFTRLGDKDDAFSLAFQTFWDRMGRSAEDQEKIYLKGPFVTDSDIITGSGATILRRDRRYLELARRIGLLAYWKSGRLPDFCTQPHRETICSSLAS